MQSTTLKFASIVDLIDFSLAMQAKTYEVDRTKLTLTAELSDADIEYALKAFSATVKKISE